MPGDRSVCARTWLYAPHLPFSISCAGNMRRADRMPYYAVAAFGTARTARPVRVPFRYFACSVRGFDPAGSIPPSPSFFSPVFGSNVSFVVLVVCWRATYYYITSAVPFWTNCRTTTVARTACRRDVSAAALPATVPGVGAAGASPLATPLRFRDGRRLRCDRCSATTALRLAGGWADMLRFGRRWFFGAGELGVRLASRVCRHCWTFHFHHGTRRSSP
jgi:hypothetical protein